MAQVEGQGRCVVGVHVLDDAGFHCVVFGLGARWALDGGCCVFGACGAIGAAWGGH